jgi:hypothetical protein
MGRYHVIEGDRLISCGHAPDGAEQLQAGPGQVCVMGDPPGFTPADPPHAGAQWDVPKKLWADDRDDAGRARDAVDAVLVARRAAYPPLNDLADALFHQSQGDDSHMVAYLAAVAAVKLAHPKVE